MIKKTKYQPEVEKSLRVTISPASLLEIMEDFYEYLSDDPERSTGFSLEWAQDIGNISTKIRNIIVDYYDDRSGNG